MEIENYNQQTEIENTIEMNQHLQVSKFLNLLTHRFSLESFLSSTLCKFDRSASRSRSTNQKVVEKGSIIRRRKV